MQQCIRYKTGKYIQSFKSNTIKEYINSIFISLDERLFSRVTSNPHLHYIRSSHLSSLHPVICGDERTTTPKQFTPPTKTKHSFLVFSILNKLIILIVHRLLFQHFFSLFLPFVVSSMLTFMTDNILLSYIIFFIVRWFAVLL